MDEQFTIAPLPCLRIRLTRNEVNNDILARFEKLLTEYYQSNKPQTAGLPSVSYCAAQFNLSTNYFGDRRSNTGL